jgi:NDP-4-keto-2,6-dideoxyhexose 3-C-methyltransferase
MVYQEVKKCRSCKGEDLLEVLDLGEPHINAFPWPAEPSSPTAPIKLVFCTNCTLVQLAHQVDLSAHFSEFFYRSSTTVTMQAALASIADAAQTRLSFHRGDTIVSIGCNDGTELRYYPEHLTKIGFEPAANLCDEARDGGNIIVNDYFSAHGFHEVSGGKAKLIQAIACMYDVPDLDAFTADISEILTTDGIFICQFTGLKHTLENVDIGNLTAEHCSFFTINALRSLFARHGLEIFDYEENGVNGGSIRLFVNHVGQRPVTWALKAALAHERNLGLDTPEPFAGFKMNAEMLKSQFHHFLSTTPEGVYGYGASTKANLVFQWLGVDRTQIRAVADKDPRKHGREMVAGRIPIVPEIVARKVARSFLVVPFGFRAEFLERERNFLDAGGRMVFLNPRFEIIGG